MLRGVGFFPQYKKNSCTGIVQYSIILFGDAQAACSPKGETNSLITNDVIDTSDKALELFQINCSMLLI